LQIGYVDALFFEPSIDGAGVEREFLGGFGYVALVGDESLEDAGFFFGGVDTGHGVGVPLFCGGGWVDAPPLLIFAGVGFWMKPLSVPLVLYIYPTP
jgi:hypothetical protein